MDSGPEPWHLPPGPVRRELRQAAGLTISAADFAPDEGDQLRLWAQAQQQAPDLGAGRHRSAPRLRPWSRRGRHR